MTSALANYATEAGPATVNMTYEDAGNLNIDVRLKILDSTLFVKHVDVSPTISLAIEKTLLRKPAQYHINRVDVKSVTVPKGSKSVSLTNVIQGVIPKIVLFTMVSSDAFVGYFMLAFDLTPDSAGQDSHTSLQSEGNGRF
uniref:Uncharacterized protein n=1 Tax=Timema shepardi TaxID=629360 RepID=A0A7R9ARN6_TIMSH|nr:unnamed protein product [Timema shepardi]